VRALSCVLQKLLVLLSILVCLLTLFLRFLPTAVPVQGARAVLFRAVHADPHAVLCRQLPIQRRLRLRDERILLLALRRSGHQHPLVRRDCHQPRRRRLIPLQRALQAALGHLLLAPSAVLGQLFVRR